MSRHTARRSGPSPLLVLSIALVLTVGTLVSLTPIKSICALGLSIVLVFSVFRASAQFESVGARWTAAAFSVPIALMVTGFFLSATHIGIRPDSVGPCLLAVVVALVATTQGSTATAGAEGAARKPRPAVSATAVALVVASLVLVTGGLLLSVASYRNWERNFEFAGLAAHFDTTNQLVVNIQNHTRTAHDYRLLASPTSTTTQHTERLVRLTSGKSARIRLAWTSNLAARLSLYEKGVSAPLRSLVVSPATATR